MVRIVFLGTNDRYGTSIRKMFHFVHSVLLLFVNPWYTQRKKHRFYPPYHTPFFLCSFITALISSPETGRLFRYSVGPVYVED